MAAVDPAEASAVALPGLGRALVSAGKLGQRAADDIYKKAQANRTSFIGELTGSGAVSAADLAHTMSTSFGAPVVDLEAIDLQRLPRGLLDTKICQAYRVVVLSKRNNRLIVATADPSDQQCAEKIKFATQMGRQLATLKIVSRLLSHELHVQQGAKQITLSREEVGEIQTCLDLFIEEVQRKQGQVGGAAGVETPLVAARNN